MDCIHAISCDSSDSFLWCGALLPQDYFNVACRTDGEGAEGLSMLLVKREFGGITTQKMDVTGWWASGTTYITFEDTKVPVEYVVGNAGNGFRQMMVSVAMLLHHQNLLPY